MVSRVVTSALLSLVLQAGGRAHAEGEPGAEAATSRDHFGKGVAAFDGGRLKEAAEEFKLAYQLSPAFVILYNLGQVEGLLGRSVQAVDAFEQYLAQGGAEIPAARREAVRKEIEAQGARIGTIEVRTSPAGAEVRVDRVLVGTTPLAKPLRVTAGPHAVEAALPGHTTEARQLEIAGRSEVAIALVLAEKVFIERAYAAPRAVAPTARPLEVESTGTVRPLRIAGYMAVVLGVATTTAGALLAHSGAQQAREANIQLADAASPAEWDRAKVDFDAGRSTNQRGWLIAGLGGALVAGGIVVLTTVPQARPAVAMNPWLMAGAGGVVFEGAW